MLIVYLREKDYCIKMPHQIKAGTRIFHDHQFYTFLSYQECKGMGNSFGESCYIKVADTKNDKVIRLDVFEFTPIVCVCE